MIRNIAEYAVYGEKLKKLHLDTLIERNLLGSFCEVLKTNNRMVNLQLIQTTSIMLANIKSAEKKCNLLKLIPCRLHYVAPLLERPDLV